MGSRSRCGILAAAGEGGRGGGDSRTTQDCPEIWELDNGDIAVIGRDATDAYHDRLPPGVSVGSDERVVIISGRLLAAAKPDIRDA